MERVKICALALSACLAAGLVAGCKKTEETTEPSGSVLETVTSESSVESESSVSTSETASSESSSEATSEDTSASSSESKSTSGDTQATGGNSSIITLDSEKQEYANTFITNFVEQYFWDFDGPSASIDRYMDFVHIHLKINSPDSVTDVKNGDITFETFSVEKAQTVIGKYFGVALKDEDCKNLSAPPTSYGEFAAGPYYSGGKIWYQAGSGESYNQIGIVDAITNNGDGTLTLKFTIYAIDLDTYSTLDSNGLKAYYKLTPAKASMDKTLSKVSYGTAVVDVSQSGTYLLKSYDKA